MKFASDITRVPFGRTDVLIGANDAPSPELSYGRGLEGASAPLFTGFRKLGFFLLRQIGIVELQKLWSDLVVQRSRHHHFDFFRDLQDGHGFMVIGVNKKLDKLET